MRFFDRLEKALGWAAIPGLIRYVALLNVLVFILGKLVPGYLHFLDLQPQRILEGQVWRLLSWIFIPTTQSYLWILFMFMGLWYFGDALESTWGTFRFNLFYWTGVVGCTLGAFVEGSGILPFNWLLVTSIFLAFATLAPEETLYLIIIPLKAKWVAWVTGGGLLLMFLGTSLGGKVSMLTALANYLLFFGPDFLRNFLHRRTTQVRKQKFQAASATLEETLHRCEICHATETSAPEREFRVTKEGKEYCSEHLPKRNSST